MKTDGRVQRLLDLLRDGNRIDLDLKAKVFDHSPHFRRRLTRRGEIAVHKDGIRRIERQRLEAAEIMLPPSGDTKFRPRMQEAEEAEGLETRCGVRERSVLTVSRRPDGTC